MQADHNVRGFVSGRVQGVGFRYFVLRHAQMEKLDGYVRNLPDGRVEFQMRGEPSAVARVIEQIRRGPVYARVDELLFDYIDASDSETGFTIR